MTYAIVDTSVLVACLRDKTQTNAGRLAQELGERDIGVPDLIGAELLAGAKSEAEWTGIKAFIDNQAPVLVGSDGWLEAARIFFDCRRQGKTVRKLADCYIAAAAIETGCCLIHDRDFEVISTVRPLEHLRLELVKAAK